jgi:hypothetical protein
VDDHPWDTGSFYCEVWNGDYMAPLVQLNQLLLNAIHYAPCYAVYTPSIECESNFWVLVNTEMSGGGWPSLIGDDSPPSPSVGDHSYYSDDFFVWEPWSSADEGGDYFIRTNFDATSIERSTWGGIKVMFDL